jgi:hypothetical protein
LLGIKTITSISEETSLWQERHSNSGPSVKGASSMCANEWSAILARKHNPINEMFLLLGPKFMKRYYSITKKLQ